MLTPFRVRFYTLKNNVKGQPWVGDSRRLQWPCDTWTTMRPGWWRDAHACDDGRDAITVYQRRLTKVVDLGASAEARSHATSRRQDKCGARRGDCNVSAGAPLDKEAMTTCFFTSLLVSGFVVVFYS
ncbi:hypothetical protein SESBI_21035 [Sesbania bispinosa]|nr:hypothetical protein SESBI_21035 [Sesbania bispinosa]